jgi:hypothetical protein
MPTTGVVGQPWRAEVTPWGSIVPWDGGPDLDWHVAADDRWHDPCDEPSMRQQRVDGTAVFETRLRVPDGDVVQHIYSVADHGGLTVIEFANESPLPVAVALSRRNLLTSRPPTAVPIEGIDLPSETTTVLPVGHRSSVAVALAHAGASAGRLPAGLPPAEQVARGWRTVLDRASRLDVPDTGLAEAVRGARCELLLGGPPPLDDDPVGALLGVTEMVRLGEPVRPWLDEVAEAVEQVAPVEGWDADAALDGAGVVLHRAGEHRAVADIERIVAKRARSPLPVERPDDLRLVAWAERRIARGSVVLPAGLPPSWAGSNFEVFDIPTGPASALSFAVRWHGARPAMLWEQTGQPLRLTAPAIDPSWSTTDPKGETLWPA